MCLAEDFWTGDADQLKDMNIITAEVNHSIVSVVPLAVKAKSLLEHALTAKLNNKNDLAVCLSDDTEPLQTRLDSLKRRQD